MGDRLKCLVKYRQNQTKKEYSKLMTYDL